MIEFKRNTSEVSIEHVINFQDVVSVLINYPALIKISLNKLPSIFSPYLLSDFTYLARSNLWIFVLGLISLHVSMSLGLWNFQWQRQWFLFLFSLTAPKIRPLKAPDYPYHKLCSNSSRKCPVSVTRTILLRKYGIGSWVEKCL